MKKEIKNKSDEWLGKCFEKSTFVRFESHEKGLAPALALALPLDLIQKKESKFDVLIADLDWRFDFFWFDSTWEKCVITWFLANNTALIINKINPYKIKYPKIKQSKSDSP